MESKLVKLNNEVVETFHRNVSTRSGVIATANAVRTFLIPETVRLSAHGEALDSTPFFP
jgi:hypothetical protein